MSIIKKLNALAESVTDEVEDLNYGGCGVFAAMVAKFLNDKGIPATCFACYSPGRGDPGNSITEARKLVEDVGDCSEWEDNGVSFYHVGVEFKHRGRMYFFDSHGVVAPADEFHGIPVQEGRLTLDEMEAMAERPHNWNRWFNRQQIPHLQSLVKEHLNERI